MEEVDAIKRTLDKYGSREQRRAAEQADREELFARAEAGRRVKSEMDEEAQVSVYGCCVTLCLRHFWGLAAVSWPAASDLLQGLSSC